MNHPISSDEPAHAGRIHALDALRAAAMLLGVVYHGTAGVGNAGQVYGEPSAGLRSLVVLAREYSHSFRMPLFFLLAGFFCHMMLRRYGFWKYLHRRGLRIAVALAVCLAAIAAVQASIQELTALLRSGRNRPSGIGNAESPASLEWPVVWADGTSAEAMSFDAPAVESARDRLRQYWGRRIFGDFSLRLRLEHLWFLWYLLLLAVVVPAVSVVLSRLTGCPPAGWFEERRRSLAAVFSMPGGLAVVSLPVLMIASSKWKLERAAGAQWTFPDFLFRFQVDLPFYAVFFLAGWWLFVERRLFPGLVERWPRWLILGMVGHFVSVRLSHDFLQQTHMAGYSIVRIGAYMLYSVGMTYTVFGWIGLFLRHFNHPNVVVRYFADAAFWIYVVHYPICDLFAFFFARFGVPFAVNLFLTPLALVLACVATYELLFRRNLLAWLFVNAVSGASKHDSRI